MLPFTIQGCKTSLAKVNIDILDTTVRLKLLKKYKLKLSTKINQLQASAYDARR